MDFDKVVSVLHALAESGVEYVLAGGVALNLHGIVRGTDDIDVFVRADEANIGRLRRALRLVWNDPSIDEIQVTDLSGDYPVVRYGPPGVDFVIDIMSRLGEAVSFDDLRWEELVVREVPVRVARPETLYWMKKDTVRLIDRADAEALRDAFGLEG